MLTLKHKLSLLLGLGVLIAVFSVGTFSSIARADGETYTWQADGTIIASGGYYATNAKISNQSGPWTIISNSQLNFNGSKCTVGSGSASGFNLIFNVDKGKNTIAFSGRTIGDASSCPSVSKLGTGTVALKGGAAPTGPTSSSPTSCDSYTDSVQQTACRQGMSNYGSSNSDTTAADKSCDSAVYDTSPTNSKLQLTAICKQGVVFAYTTNMQSLFGPIGALACADETGGTAASCRSNFDKQLTTCTNSSRGNFDSLKSCLKTAYPAQATAIDAVTLGGTKTDAGTSNCKIDEVGWIICPVVNLLANVVDGAYAFVASLLVVQPLMTTGTSASVYGAWSTMRNFANVAFVIAFIIIIFSQLTSIGLNNYGIKKMLPRLIVAAIFVNVSYWVCAIAVDASNIIGASLNGLMKGLVQPVPGRVPDASGISTGTGWAGIVGFVLAGTLATHFLLYAELSALLPAIIAAVIAIVTVFLVLTLRQALIIMLVVISPLAFVAYLLPNTEKWFTKWRQLFQTLLLMYPIIAFLFGASAFASAIVMNSASGTYKIPIQIMGALISIIPLALTPIVMKTAGGLLSRFGGVVNNPNKGPFDRMRKGAVRIREDREGKRAVLAMNGGRMYAGARGKYQRQAKREAVSQGIKKEVTGAKSQFIADEIQNNEGFRNRVAGGSNGAFSPDATPAAMQRALSGAKLTIDNAVAENIKAEAVIVRDMDTSALKGILSDTDASEEKKAAAMQRLVKISDPGGPDGYASEVNSALGGSETLRRATADALASNGPGYLKASDIDRIATGNHTNSVTGARSTLQTIALENVRSGVYSQKKMVEETTGNLQFAFDAADLAGKQRMVNTAADLKANDTLNGDIKHNAQSIDNLSTGMRP